MRIARVAAACAGIALVSISVAGASNTDAGVPPLGAAAPDTIAAPAACAGERAACQVRIGKRARFVSPKGSDSNPGTLKRPWKTIGMAVRTLRPGETAYLRKGVYREEVDGPCNDDYNTVEWKRSGRRGAPITISGYPGEERRVVLKTEMKLSGNHVRLVRLVSGRNTALHAVDKACTGDANITVYGDDIELSGLEIRESNSSGIYLSGADRARILGNWIHDNGNHPTQDHGIYFGSGTGGIVANNLIERTLGYGIHVYPRSGGQKIFQNTIVASGSSGIVLATSGNDIAVTNNIVAWSAQWGIRTDEDDCDGCWADQNVVFGNSLGAYYLPDALAVHRTIEADPQFVNRSRGDYRLQAPSPAVDQARPDFSRPYDFSGRSRPRGAGPDIGSFER